VSYAQNDENGDLFEIVKIENGDLQEEFKNSKERFPIQESPKWVSNSSVLLKMTSGKSVEVNYDSGKGKWVLKE